MVSRSRIWGATMKSVGAGTHSKSWRREFKMLGAATLKLRWFNDVYRQCDVIKQNALRYTPSAIKNGANLFLSETSWKINGF